MPMFGFDPIGSMLAWLFVLFALAAGALGITVGGLNLLVAWRYRHA